VPNVTGMIYTSKFAIRLSIDCFRKEDGDNQQIISMNNFFQKIEERLRNTADSLGEIIKNTRKQVGNV